MIAIIDYGMGNIHSVKKALESMGAKTVVTDDPQVVEKAEKIVFPGVGAFGDCMQELKNRSLDKAIQQAVRNNKIFLGICLGMQVLFDKSQEAAQEKGLGLLKGQVVKFPDRKGLKVPHMGWNQINKGQSACPLLKNISEGAYVYFCHSYYPDPQERPVTAASCDYGVNFAAAVWKDNLYGLQFHPEKSQAVGLGILKNFIEI